jgi:Acyl-CoA dehydrogenase, C-terminal domain
MDPEERDLLEDSLRRAMTSVASGAELYGALADLGWEETLAEMPETAVPLVFRLLGETGAHAPVLNDLFPPAPAPSLPYTRGSWVIWHREDVPGTAMELPVQRVPEAGDVSPEALAAGRVAVGWWLMGSGRAMLSLARQHAVDRIQFGKPIASFQAVRHKLAETLVALEGAEATLRAAADDELGSLLAKAAAGHAALLAAEHCQQVLGGIGFTAEHALHHHVKRILVLDGLLGSARELTREAGRRVITAGSAPRLIDL